MRNWLALFEGRISFDDHMIDAVSNAEMGFYFEEGGCWGMALALFDHFVQEGKQPRLVVQEQYVHAMVEVDGDFYDHQGQISPPSLPIVYCDQNKFIEIAEQNGLSFDEVQADREIAAEIISNAVDLANQ